MNIGIIGSGNMGASMGKVWAAKGHQLLFSFTRDQRQLQAVAESAGSDSRAGTPAEAVAFGDVILLARARWGQSVKQFPNCHRIGTAAVWVSGSSAGRKKSPDRVPAPRLRSSCP